MIDPKINNCYKCISEGQPDCLCNENCASETRYRLIKDQIAQESGFAHWQEILDDHIYTEPYYIEVCKRYAFEVAKASLKQAAINTQHHHPGADTSSITDLSNIKL